MRVLVLGSGGREHALCWKFLADDPRTEVHCAPGNPGIAALATCHPVSPTDNPAVVALARRLGAEVVVVGPEAPLAGGVADALQGAGIAVFGPNAAAARIESDKGFAKELMLSAGIPTAAAAVHSELEGALASVRELAERSGGRVVVKASGLAAGKGVFVCASRVEGEAAVRALMSEHTMGGAGDVVVVEEFMDGRELSVFAVCDGRSSVLLLPSRDHKRLLDGDRGPNTGGMGAFSPVSEASEELLDRVQREIVDPTLAAIAAAGAPFRGLLYAGLMLTPEGGPKVVEFNCRFGDPETQVVLPLMRTKLLDIMVRVARDGDGSLRGVAPIESNGMAAVTTIMASSGYPGTPSTGYEITIPERLPDGVCVFHSGTRRGESGSLVTAGGRVLSVTGVAESVGAARELSLATVRQIHFDGCQYRSDIGVNA